MIYITLVFINDILDMKLYGVALIKWGRFGYSVQWHWTCWDCDTCPFLDTCHHLIGSSALEVFDLIRTLIK